MNEQVDSISLGLEANQTPFLRGLSSALRALDRFVNDATGKAETIRTNFEATFGGAAKTTTALTDTVKGLDKELKTLSDTQGKANEQLAKGGDAAENATSKTQRNTDAVRQLSLAHRAGKLTTDEFIAALKNVAAAADQGSEKQLNALAKVRDAEEKSVRDSEKAAEQQISISRRKATEREKIAKAEAAAIEKAAKAEADAQNKTWKVVDTAGSGMKSAGKGLTAGVTAPLVGAAAYIVKVTLDDDQAFTDVKKFTSGTKAEMKSLEGDLRKLSLDKTVGMDFVGLSGIAAMGSQLGIEKENLAEFTREVAYVGKAGDISGEEAATGLAKIAAATQKPQKEIKLMASSLVAMGNLGSSKMSEILDTAERFASKSRMAKLDPSALFAYSNTVVSLGQHAEAAGGGLIKIFDKVDRAVNDGGEKLKEYANVAGMSADKFAKAYRDNAGQAVQAFFTGLDKQAQVAGRADKIMDALGVKNEREKIAVLNLAAGHKLLAQNIAESARAYQAGDEQKKKAAIEATSYKNQLADLQRQIKDDAYTIGKTLVPALMDVVKAGRPMIDAIHDAAQRFHELSPEAQQAWLKVALGLALMGPLISGLGNVVGWVVRLREAFVLLKAMQAAQELAQTAKSLSDVASASTGAVNGISSVASGAAGAAGEVSLLSRGLAALAATGPISIPWNTAKRFLTSSPAACRGKSDAGSMSVYRLRSPSGGTIQKPKGLGFDVTGGVQIPIKGRAAPQTNPNPVGKRKRLDVAALVAGFGGRVEPAHLHDLPCVPSGFIFQLPQKLGKRGVTERFSQFGSH